MGIEYTTATTGIGFSLGVRNYVAGSTTGTYTAVPFLVKLMPPSRDIDGADTTTLAGVLQTDTPTLPKYEASGTVQVVESDPGYQLMDLSCKQFPVTLIDFKLTYPSGATKAFTGWLNSWKPSELNVKDIRSMDFTISQQTVTVYTPATGS